MLKFDPALISSQRLHQIILGSIAPRPIAFASTVDKDGVVNLSPFSFFNAFGVNPTTLIFSPSRRGRDNTTKHTYENIKEVPEVVINIVSYDMVNQVSLASTEYDRGVNEFVKAGFTPLASEKIRPFRVAESPVQYECKVRQVIETGSGGGAANLIICEVLMVHLREDILDDKGSIDPEKIRLVGRMGGDFYLQAFGNGLFKVAKPLGRLGMGIDRLPEFIRNSHTFSGNDLGMLGNIEHLPQKNDLAHVYLSPAWQEMQKKFGHDAERFAAEIQWLAKDLLSQGQAWEALCMLLA
jgi:flavin reductase (DIM6/NTAB) family NADH-FMN oxidoreductase RutF